MNEFVEITIQEYEELLEVLLNNRNTFYGSKGDIDAYYRESRENFYNQVHDGEYAQRSEQRRAQDKDIHWETDNDNLKLFAETDEELMQISEEIADIHGEASFINAIVHMNGEGEGDIDFHRLHVLEEYEKFSVELKCFFINEIKRYFMGRDKYKYAHRKSLLEEAWLFAVYDNRGRISGRSRYPVRKRVEKIFASFVEHVYAFYENREYTEGVARLFGNEYDIDNYEELVGLIDRSKQILISDNANWKNSVELLNEALSFFRRNLPGSIGHLLWIILYLSELLFYQTIDKNANYGEENRRIKESQPSRLWDSLEEGDDSLYGYHSLLAMLSSSFYEKQTNEIALLNNYMCMCYMRSSGTDGSAGKEAFKQAKSVLHRDRDLRVIFVYTRDDGGTRIPPSTGMDTKSRCFAVLSNGKGTNYLAISGFKDDVYNRVKAIFMSKCIKGTTYTVIDKAKYGLSKYIWNVSSVSPGNISMDKTERERVRRKLRKPQHYVRMFSCAERRLVDQYRNEPNKTGFKIYSRLSPCYMCERVLNFYNIPWVSFDPYTMSDEAKIKIELDNFAGLLVP